MASLQAEIRRLAQSVKPSFLAHNYQRPEVQDVADYVGVFARPVPAGRRDRSQRDHLLRRHFMAETAAILSPQKRVLLPDLRAGMLARRHHYRGRCPAV